MDGGQDSPSRRATGHNQAGWGAWASSSKRPTISSPLLSPGSRVKTTSQGSQFLGHHSIWGKPQRSRHQRESSQLWSKQQWPQDIPQNPLIPHSFFFFFLRLPQLLIFNWIQLKKCGPVHNSSWTIWACQCHLLLRQHSISPTFLASRKSSSLFSYRLYLSARFWPPRAARPPCTGHVGGPDAVRSSGAVSQPLH